MNKNKKPREENDFYPTPVELADEVVQRYYNEELFIVEPSAGRGSFLKALRRYTSARVDAIEPFEDLPGAIRCTFEEYEPDRAPDLIIGNPPYRLAESHIRRAMGMLAPGGRLVLVLRLNFLGSRRRRGFWEEFMPVNVDVLVPRPSFREDGKTDGTEYAVFEWVKGSPGTGCGLGMFDWRE